MHEAKLPTNFMMVGAGSGYLPCLQYFTVFTLAQVVAHEFLVCKEDALPPPGRQLQAETEGGGPEGALVTPQF